MGAITACAEDIGKRKGKPSIPGRKLLDPCREEERGEEGETAPVRAESRRWTGNGAAAVVSRGSGVRTSAGAKRGRRWVGQSRPRPPADVRSRERCAGGVRRGVVAA